MSADSTASVACASRSIPWLKACAALRRVGGRTALERWRSLGERWPKLARQESRTLARVSAAVASCARLRQALSQGMDREAQATEAVLSALMLPQETPEEQARRDAAVETATRHPPRCLSARRGGYGSFERLVQLEAFTPASIMQTCAWGARVAARRARGALENVTRKPSSLRDPADSAGIKSARRRLKRGCRGVLLTAGT